ncbi:cardiomyopathy-associated protein 5-like, partial [Scleropages formosus]
VIEEGETGAGAVDDNDDIVELCKSLKEIVEDQTVKPRLQCLTVDPSFSMVTVQSEDSGIVWETVSSRCSTPWASEGSTTSEAYSLEGSGAQGKVIIIMDEDKIVRKRKKRSGSKLGDRLKRPSSRSFPGGNERPFMTEIAVPNIRPEGTGENGESTDLKQEKEQRLFSLVSEGYEILNIVVPSRLATVDEEESTDIADNLSYLENTPQIKSKHIQEATELPETISKTEEVKEDQEVKKVEEENVVSVEPQSSQDSVSKACGNDGTSDTDYFEKFTLLDDNLPGDVSEGAEEHVQSKVSQGSALLENQEKSTRSANEDAFVLIGDVEMASEHLDEVFYKNGGHDELVESAFIKQQERDEEESADEGRHMKSFIKESGSALFGSQETILTPIFLPSGPPKIIDPVLLEEPAALPFLYTDLYEEAMGEKKKEDDFSDVESVISEKSFKRRHSDSDDSEGYLEKFILKDETPVVEREPVESLNKGGLQMWAQSKFDLTGCLTRVEEEEEEEEEEDIKEEEVNTVQKPIETDEENEEDDQKERQDVLKHREVSYSALRSFPGQVDLSMFGKEESLSDQGEKTAEELGYEMITQQEARDLEPEGAQKDELNHERDHKFSKLHDHYIPTEELLETEYEIIEAPDGTPLSEGRQEQIDSNAQAMDTFCLVCQCPIVAKDKLYGEHQDHEVLTLDEAYDDFRNKLGEWISVLQERSEKIEDLVSELELAYNSVEEHFKTCEETLDRQNQEILKLVMDQYNEMSQTMEEEKKVKLEQLYDQIVEFQDNIDLAKEALDRTVKEIESSVDINQRLTSALESSLSLELTPRAFPMFEDYSKSPSGRGRKELEGIPIPQKPRLQAQEANSATSTSVTVYWKVNEGDVIDCFQVYCMEEPQRAISEEYRVTVKESYCTLEDLEPDKNYKVWVMAVNYTGCSLPSEKLSFRTAPSIPTINTERCTICWDFAIIRWSPSDRRTAESFTLEYCRQYACEGEGLRSISGIKQCEQKVLLLPNENYLFYIKAVNTAGSSDQSEATLISTRGTRFHLLKDTAHPALELSEDMTTVHWRDGNISQRGMAGYSSSSNCLFGVCVPRSPGVLGEVLPPRGYHYWEISVRDCQAYRIGVMYHSAAHHDALQENNTSWCLHCIPTSNSCRFHLYHDSLKTDIIAAEAPASIGTLLDFIHGRLSFFDGQSGRMLGSCCHRFSKACQAALVLDQPGSLAVCAVSEVPEFAKRH